MTCTATTSTTTPAAAFAAVGVGRLLRLVGSGGGVPGRRALQHVERLPGHDHVAVAGAVDQLAVVVGDVADDLAGGDLRLDALALVEIEHLQDGPAGLA